MMMTLASRAPDFLTNALAVKRASDKEAMQPTALIVGFPWLRSGAGKVFEAQMEYFQAAGWKAIFIAVPFSGGHVAQHPAWEDFAAQAVDLPHFPYLIQTVGRRVRKPNILQEMIFPRERKTSLDLKFQISENVVIDGNLRKLMEQNDVRAIVGNYVYSSPFCLKLRDALRAQGKDVQLATVTHDVQSHLISDNKKTNRGSAQPDSADLLLRQELDMLSRSDLLIHVSDDDLTFFARELPQMRHVLALPPIAEQRLPAEAAKWDLLFVGSSNIPNLKAVQWYFREAAQYYASEPSLAIVGSISGMVADKDAQLFGARSGHFLGSVADPAAYYMQSRAALVPMVSGRGISIKTIEALAYGKPVVGTRLAFRGIPAAALREYGIQHWDDPAEFAHAAAAMLANPQEHAERSRRFHKALFTFDRFAASMTDALQSAGIRV
jgi:glycosyltransferase involved in cell wall biosynthesis